MHFRTPQGVGSKTFRVPPYGTATLPEILESHATQSQYHPLFTFKDPEAPDGTRTIYYPEGARAVRRTAHTIFGHYARFKEKYEVQKKERGILPTFGILAHTDIITYFCLAMGTMKLGCIIFPISTRNSPAAVAHLIAKSGVLQLFVGPDPAMQRVATEALEILSKEETSVELLALPQFSELFLEENEERPAPQPIEKIGLDEPALILHTSGSTGFPKPILLTHRMLLNRGFSFHHGEMDLCSIVYPVHATPIFHSGGTTALACAFCCGLIISCFKPASPAPTPTPESVLREIRANDCKMVIIVPSMLEKWAESADAVATLKSLRVVAYVGAPLSNSVGNHLVQEGVNLTPVYGATEFGNGTLSYLEKRPNVDDWEYFALPPEENFVMVPQEGLENTFELVVFNSKEFTVATNTVIDGREAYATNDLFLRHPTDPSRYKIYGRADDQLMLSTGEKTNPGPLEAILVSDIRIATAIMFGRGRFQNGVLVQPEKEYIFDSSDEQKLSEFRNAIWSTVEKANEYAPAHSRVFKEMIVVTVPEKPLEYTAKGNARKKAALIAYANEIEAAYSAVQDSAQIDVLLPSEWTTETASKFVQAVINHVLRNPVSETSDIFHEGCDSLKATHIRNIILHALRKTSRVSVREIGQNFVYTYPTVQSLGGLIVDLVARGTDGQPKINGPTAESKIGEMEALVAKYGADFNKHAPLADPALSNGDVGEIILLTGSTGRFGSYLLAKLILDPNVTRVFACNRAKEGSDLNDRQRAVFTEWGLDVELLASPKVQLVEIDAAQSHLGLKRNVYDQIRNSITSIIHNAWRVDFNLTLSSFEPVIKGVRNLIDLSLSSPKARPPRILFTSSIGVLRGYTSAAPETAVSDARIAIGNGYSEGKWVAEHILELASQGTGLKTTIVRVGQLSGGSRDGAWNRKEWIPAIVRVGQLIGCLPLRNEEVAWIPADVAASALSEMRSTDETFLHLVHPRSVRWATLFEGFGEALGLPLVPYSEWLGRLEGYQRESTETESALSLMDFYRTVGVSQEMGRSIRTELACEASPSLACADALDKESAGQWVGYWRRVGFL